jgi:predicted nucleotidyltransferase
MDRIALAKAFVDEQLQTRPAILAAMIVGSVARGEDTAASDIDLGLLVDDATDAGMQRGGGDAWREGVYIEAAIVAKREYADLDTVLHDPFKATHLNDALILYDPTGFLAQMQQSVRAVFMEDKWLNVRLAYWRETAQTNLATLRTAVAAGDPLGICEAAGWIPFSLISTALLRVGKTPSSSRGMVQLDAVAKELKHKLCDFQGAAQLSAEEIRSLHPLLVEGAAIIEQTSSATWGQLPAYFIKKISWMAQTGLHQEALQPMWLLVWTVIKNSQASNDDAIRDRGATLVSEWLRRLGWDEPASLTAKVQLAESLLAETKVLATR